MYLIKNVEHQLDQCDFWRERDNFHYVEDDPLHFGEGGISWEISYGMCVCVFTCNS